MDKLYVCVNFCFQNRNKDKQCRGEFWLPVPKVGTMDKLWLLVNFDLLFPYGWLPVSTVGHMDKQSRGKFWLPAPKKGNTDKQC